MCKSKTNNNIFNKKHQANLKKKTPQCLFKYEETPLFDKPLYNFTHEFFFVFLFVIQHGSVKLGVERWGGGVKGEDKPAFLDFL